MKYLKIGIKIFVFYLMIGNTLSVQANEKVTVILDWFLNSSHESLLAAKYSGAFERHHLDVELIAPADPGMPPRMVAAGKADLAISYPIQLGMMVDQSIPLIRIGTLLDTPLDTLIVGPNISEIRDLKGKKIGVSIAGDERSILSTLLENAGVKLSDVQVINVNFQLEQALLTGKVDAITGANRNYEWIDLQQRQFKGKVFYPEEYGVPICDELIFIARKDAAHDPKFKEFMLALQEGTNYLLNHHEEIYEKAVKDFPQLVSPLNKAAWIATLPRVSKNPGLLDKGKYERLYSFLRQKGVIHKNLPLSDYTIDILQ